MSVPVLINFRFSVPRRSFETHFIERSFAKQSLLTRHSFETRCSFESQRSNGEIRCACKWMCSCTVCIRILRKCHKTDWISTKHSNTHLINTRHKYIACLQCYTTFDVPKNYYSFNMWNNIIVDFLLSLKVSASKFDKEKRNLNKFS